MIAALIPAAGGGSRLGAGVPKQYLDLAGRPLVCHAIETFAAVAQIDLTLMVVAPDDTAFRDLPLSQAARAKTEFHPVGGASRQASVARGLEILSARLGDEDWVLVHDAARPGLTPAQVEAMIAALREDPLGGLLAVPVADTLKRGVASSDGVHVHVHETVTRAGLWQAQTPQMFRVGRLREALRAAAAAGVDVTDEASAIERLGGQPRLILGSYRNFKVTYPEDLEHARALLDRQSLSEGIREKTPMGFRIGQGFDVHALVAGRPLIIGGVTIAHPTGLLGHSDADVLYHAITDALLGAAGLGDIGGHFPDTEPLWKDADSGLLLAAAAQKVRAAGYAPVNVDATVLAQAPRLAPHIRAMVANIARHLGLPEGSVNVKAKTAEGLGFLGRLEGIAAEAAVLLETLG